MRIAKLIRVAGIFAALTIPAAALTGCDDEEPGLKTDGGSKSDGSVAGADGSVRNDAGTAGTGGGGSAGSAAGSDGSAGAAGGAGGSRADGGPDGSADASLLDATAG